MTAIDIVVRDIDGQAEMRAVEELQKEVWGLPDLDVVPLTQLVAAKACGGVVIGAFDREILVGFAYGFAGYEEGRVTHHSHMLAVRPSYRSFNIGYRLKLAQREKVLEQGIERMTWTFDPLQSLNAYFNFGKLGVISGRYFVDFYGEDAASFLHRNGTDRLWVTWLLASRRVNERLDKAVAGPAFDKAKPLVELGEDNEPHVHDLSSVLSEDRIVIEIPPDINALERQSAELAGRWRTATRTAFTGAIAAGFMVEDFSRGIRGERLIGAYFLRRSSDGPASKE